MTLLTATWLIFERCQLLTLVPLPAADAGVELVVLPSTKTLRVGDPLLVRVGVANRTQKDISLPAPLGDKYGTVQLELRRKGEAEFARTGAKFSGLKSGVYPVNPIPPSKFQVSYEALYRFKDRPVFPAAGDYELRAVAWIDGRELASEVVSIQVRELPPKEKEILDKLAVVANAPGAPVDLVHDAFGLHLLPKHVDPAKLSNLEQQLTPSHLKQTVQWLLAVQAVRSAATPQDRDRALAALAERRKELDPVSSEALDLVLAAALLDGKQLAAAEKVLEKIKEPSDDRDKLQRLLQEQKYQAPAGK